MTIRPFRRNGTAPTTSSYDGPETRWQAVPSGLSPLGRLARCRDLAAQRLERGDIDLGEGGEGLDRVAQHLERHAGTDRQRGLLDPLTRLGAQGVRAGQPVTVAEKGQEA